MKGLFITGTDTGVGKTFVACALARLAVARGLRVFAFKPIETGCRPMQRSTWNGVETARQGPTEGERSTWNTAEETGALVGEDQTALVQASGGWQTGELVGLYRFALPAAPSVAADAPIELARILSIVQKGSLQSDWIVVEGAGGWRVPISSTLDMSGLARALGLPVLLVARAGLGTINHTRLSVEAIEKDGPRLAGVVLSRRPEDPDWLVDTNLAELRTRIAARVEATRSPDDLDWLLPSAVAHER